MKKLFYILLLSSSTLLSQVDSETQFIQFGVSSAREQQVFMIQSDWTATQPKRWVEDGVINEQLEYGKKINGVPFMLRMLYKVDKDQNQLKSVKVLFTDVTIYNKWVTNLKKQGYVFKEYEKGKFAATEEDYTVYYEKLFLTNSTMYVFEVISF